MHLFTKLCCLGRRLVCGLCCRASPAPKRLRQGLALDPETKRKILRRLDDRLKTTDSHPVGQESPV
jgi:hypothetical protein